MEKSYDHSDPQERGRDKSREQQADSVVFHNFTNSSPQCYTTILYAELDLYQCPDEAGFRTNSKQRTT